MKSWTSDQIKNCVLAAAAESNGSDSARWLDKKKWEGGGGKIEVFFLVLFIYLFIF